MDKKFSEFEIDKLHNEFKYNIEKMDAIHNKFVNDLLQINNLMKIFGEDVKEIKYLHKTCSSNDGITAYKLYVEELYSLYNKFVTKVKKATGTPQEHKKVIMDILNKPIIKKTKALKVMGKKIIMKKVNKISFIKYPKTKERTQTDKLGIPKIFISVNGRINFTRIATIKYNLQKWTYAVPYFDDHNIRIGITLSNDKTEGNKINWASGVLSFSAISFLKTYNIDYSKYKQYNIDYDKNTNMFIINLNYPYNKEE